MGWCDMMWDGVGWGGVGWGSLGPAGVGWDRIGWRGTVLGVMKRVVMEGDHGRFGSSCVYANARRELRRRRLQYALHRLSRRETMQPSRF